MKTPWKALNYPQIRRGIEFCNDNVDRLLRNATLALGASQWPATIYNSVLAMEEQAITIVHSGGKSSKGWDISVSPYSFLDSDSPVFDRTHEQPIGQNTITLRTWMSI